MKWIASLVLLVAAACGAGDDTTDGTRGKCAFGGALNDCPDPEKTPQGVCWRLVDCGAIPIDAEEMGNPGQEDWGVCMNRLETMTADRERLVIECIAASTCDELRVTEGDLNGICFRLGN